MWTSWWIKFSEINFYGEHMTIWTFLALLEKPLLQGRFTLLKIELLPKETIPTENSKALYVMAIQQSYVANTIYSFFNFRGNLFVEILEYRRHIFSYIL